jgi:hypothetical protein
MEYLDYFYYYVIGNFQIIGFAVLIYMFFFDEKKLKVDFNVVAKFVGFMVLITFIRVGLLDIPEVSNAFANKGLSRTSFYRFLFVGLEDLFFVMIPLYLCKFCKTKTLRFAIWVFFTGFFAIGHIYQGIFAVFVTGLYPYFISRKYTLKHGLGTVIACHFLYDCFTLSAVKFVQILQLLRSYY